MPGEGVGRGPVFVLKLPGSGELFQSVEETGWCLGERIRIISVEGLVVRVNNETR